MVTKYLGGYQTPQYGWVTADPAKSGQNNALQQAAQAYQQMYGKAVNPQLLQPLTKAQLAMQNPQNNKKGVVDKDPFSDQQKDLLAWYQASKNQKVTGDATNRRYLDMMADGLRQKTKQELIQDQQNAYVKQLTGASHNDPFAKFGQDVGREKALQARLAFEQSAGTFGQPKDEPLSAFGGLGRMGSQAQDRPDYELNPFANIPGLNVSKSNGVMSSVYDSAMKSGATQYGGQKITDADKAAWNARQTQKVEGITPFQTQILRNPNYYQNPSLTRYFDGPNADLWTGRKISSWSTKPGDGSNRSMELGGEVLADDVFNFYKNRSQQGTLADSGELENNPYSRKVSFNGNNSYFTPYQYAIHGNEGSMNTNVSAKDPNYWKNSGNLQQLDGQWGFVTNDDPTGNMTLSPETVDYWQKYKKKSGMFGGGFGSVLGLGMSALGAPWAMGIPSMAGTASSLAGGSSGGGGAYPTKVSVTSPQWNTERQQGLFRAPTYKAPKMYRGPKFTYQAPRG